MPKIYVVYDTDEMVWGVAYTSWAYALAAVQAKIDKINETYKLTPDYETDEFLPGTVEAGVSELSQNTDERGILVAGIHDYRQQIFIKAVELLTSF